VAEIEDQLEGAPHVLARVRARVDVDELPAIDHGHAGDDAWREEIAEHVAAEDHAPRLAPPPEHVGDGRAGRRREPRFDRRGHARDEREHLHAPLGLGRGEVAAVAHGAVRELLEHAAARAERHHRHLDPVGRLGALEARGEGVVGVDAQARADPGAERRRDRDERVAHAGSSPPLSHAMTHAATRSIIARWRSYTPCC
jgi:hypothetical protein